VPSLVVVVAAAVAIPLTLTGDVHQRGGQPGHSTSASASTGSPTAPGAASWQVPRDESLDGRNSWVLNSYVAAHQVIVVSAQVIVGYDQHSGRRRCRSSLTALISCRRTRSLSCCAQTAFPAASTYDARNAARADRRTGRARARLDRSPGWLICQGKPAPARRRQHLRASSRLRRACSR
jgi:hypothetical protein